MNKTLGALTLAAASLGAALPASAAIVVRFEPASTSIAIGESVEVSVRISGLGDEILGAFDTNTVFDESILDNFVVTFPNNPFGGLADSYVQADFQDGNTDVIGGSYLDDDALAAVQPDDFVMLTFSFEGRANGFSFVDMGLDAVFERNFVGRRFQTLDVQVIGTCIAVGTGSCPNNVPEPSTFGLAGLALLGLAAPAWRRRRPTRG
jgi:MYXO-CTERM domain-containing protein